MAQEAMTIYHAEINSAAEAEVLVKRHKPEIEAAGGIMTAAHSRGRGGSIVMVQLPATQDVDPANLLPGSGLKFSKVRAQVIQVPRDGGAA